MKYTKAMRSADFFKRMEKLGFTYTEADKLRSIEKTLHRWSEHECNGNIQREGDNGEGKPRWHSSDDSKGYRIADREAGALRRLQQIMANHPALWFYHQGDPRGCALYIGRVEDIRPTDNPIVTKAKAMGLSVEITVRGVSGDNPRPPVYGSPQLPGIFNNPEQAARRFLKQKGETIPDRERLPLESYYNRGTAVCID